jgi:hypothetical protein
MRRRALLLLLGSACLLPAQSKYTGPRPAKPDVAYLVHADNLVSTEVLMAKEDKRKGDDIAYVMPGAVSPARTPLASPILLFQAEKLQPERLSLFKLDVKNGQREVVMSRKRPGKPLRISVNPLTRERLYRIEVEQSLENGEYSLSPEGSNIVFCFSVY